MDRLTDSVARFLKTHCQHRTVWVACSGGLDSMVLLHLVAKAALALPLTVRAVHVHHGVQSLADDWLRHCEAEALRLSIPFVSERLSLQVMPESDPENQLRQLRYAAFARCLQPGDFLLTAHHQEDQAETVLLQLLRGAGPKGLAAMPVIKPFAHGYLARPLLSFERGELQRLAEAEGWKWCEDPSNRDRRYARNHLRHDILPLLQQRWPAVIATLARVADNCADVHHTLNGYLEEDRKTCAGSLPGTLSVKKCLAMNERRRAGIVRDWIASQGFELPSRKKLQQVLQEVLLAGQDREPQVCWGRVEVRRYRDDLYVLASRVPHDVTQVIAWDGREPLVIAHLGTLRAKITGNFLVQFRQGSEMCELPGRRGRHALKKIFQEKGVPPWERERIPLVYSDGKLVAAVGVFCRGRPCACPGACVNEFDWITSPGQAQGLPLRK